MATAQYTYHPFHTIGAATVQVWDPDAVSGGGAWRVFGRVADAAVNVATEQAGKDLVVKGLSQPIARRNRARRYSVAFRLLEDANPETLEMLFADGAAQAANSGGLRAVSEVMRLYGGDYRELSHPYGIPANSLGGVGQLQATAGGSGGLITPGTYYYWVAPAMEDPGRPPLEGLTEADGPVTVASGEVVTITFTPPDGYTPDLYRVYFNDTQNLAEAALIGEATNGSPITVASHLESGTYQGPAEPVLQLWSGDGLTMYERDVDYSLLAERGMIKRIADGNIAEGTDVLAVYAYFRRSGVETSLGDVVDLERYRRIRLLQLSPDGPDPASWQETGLEFELFRVQTAANDTSFVFSEEEYGEGSPVSWDCMYDGSEGKVGSVRSSFAVLSNY